ncbi:MAG: KamA family radical SAM protein [Candidatus Micrarchaeota archaeon]
MRWKDELKECVCTVQELKQYVRLKKKEERQLQEVVHVHPMRITRYYLSLINKDDPNDPLRKMIVPSPDELDMAGTYDTSGEKENTISPGLQHKYRQTALILATNRCAQYCRFCFRKRLIGLPSQEILRRFGEAIDYIQEHGEINNVLVSGGDPLILPTRIIRHFLEKLSVIDHLDFIRFGSRVPVAFPQRIYGDKQLLRLLKKYSWKKRRIYVVTHFNHPREITDESIEAVDSLFRSNVVVNNQAVLMRGVNDDPAVLAELMNKLVAIGVNPYYLFQCRPVKRVKHHFQVPIYEGVRIVEEAKKQLNGHSKRFRYVMSHKSGKIEILGTMGKDVYFKYHQAKNERDSGRFFRRKLNVAGGWLDDFD